MVNWGGGDEQLLSGPMGIFIESSITKGGWGGLDKKRKKSVCQTGETLRT